MAFVVSMRIVLGDSNPRIEALRERVGYWIEYHLTTIDGKVHRSHARREIHDAGIGVADGAERTSTAVKRQGD